MTAPANPTTPATPATPPAQAWRGGEVSPAQLKDLLRQGRARLVDVRTAAEVRDWPLPDAVHAPLDQLLARPPPGLPADAPLVTVCAHGNRSRVAAQALAARGYSAASLRGGMAAWARTYDAATAPLGAGQLTQVRRLGKGCLSYVVEADGEAAVIDPTCHLEAVTEVVHQRGLKVRHIMDTHRHADHLSGAVELARATGGQLHLSAGDGYARDLAPALGEGAQFALGTRQAVVLQAVATPGHTPGSVSFLAEDAAAFTGDALFLDGLARPDLRDKPREHARVLWQTYRRMADWPEGLAVLPAHLSARWPFALGAVATRPLGEVRHALHAFRLDEAAFVERILGNLPERPPNSEEILERNRRGEGCDPEAAEELEAAGGNRCVVT